MDSANIYNLAFYGKTRYLSCNSDGKAKTVSDCPFGTAYFGETRGLSEFVKRRSYPYARIEETIGKLHDNKTYKIYISEPQEVVNDLIKQKHDYIVYDLEPNFPDIRLFFNAELDDFRKGFQVVKDYFKRLECSSITQGNIDILNLSKLKQNIAELGAQIFDEGKNLRVSRSNLEVKLNARYVRIKEIKKNIPLLEKELVSRRKKLVNQEKLLEVKERGLDNSIYRRCVLREKPNRTPEDINRVNKQIERYQEIIRSIKSKIFAHKRRIEYIEKYIEQAPQNISQWNQDIKEIKQQISDINRALVPNFKKLKEFYTVNGIKFIKHI